MQIERLEWHNFRPLNKLIFKNNLKLVRWLSCKKKSRYVCQYIIPISVVVEVVASCLCVWWEKESGRRGFWARGRECMEHSSSTTVLAVIIIRGTWVEEFDYVVWGAHMFVFCKLADNWREEKPKEVAMCMQLEKHCQFDLPAMWFWRRLQRSVGMYVCYLNYCS
jgi:hypothetical protein